MLKFFNRLEKTRNFVLLIFSILMVASLVFFYAPTQSNTGVSLARSEETAAKVAGEKISVGDIFMQREAYSRYTQGQPYPAKMILDGLIANRIVRIEARRLGLTASDAEVATAIREQFKPADGKPFDQKQYEANVTEQFGSVTAFESSVRDELSGNKLRAFLTAGVVASEEDVLKEFQKKNTKFDLSYVVVNAADIAKTITPTDEELREYFEKNKNAYHINYPQKKIRYVFINTAKIGEKLPISDADLKAEYDKLPDDKKKAGVLGQEIVLRVAKPDLEPQVLTKANEVIERLKKDGPVVSEETFAGIAKGYSENATTADNGGKLPGPVKENLNNPSDPYQRLLSMKPGEITEPISYQGRYFILRRGEDVPKPFEAAKKEIEVSLRNRRAYAVAAELAQKAAETLKQNKDVAATAKQFAGEANMNPTEMVRETGYVKPGDSVENIGTSPQFEEGIAGLANPNDVGDKIPVQNGFAIPLLVDKKEPRDAEFDEVKSQLVEIVKFQNARAKVGDLASRIAAASTNAAAIAAAASSNGLKALDEKAYILGSPLGQGPSAATDEALEDAIFAMKDGEATKSPIKIGDSYFIVGVTHRDEANMDEFAKQRSTLMEQMQSQKRGEVFADYMAATRQKMEANGDITIYADAVAKLDEPEAPVEGMPPGLPEGTFPGNAPPGQPAGGSDQPVKTLNF